MKVPFSNLYLQYKSIKNELDSKIAEVIKKSAFSGGPYVSEFEKGFSKLNQSKYCVGVNSGTAALHLCLWLLGIGKGDEVIVPTFTFIATAEGVSLTGATPLFVDSEKLTNNIDPEKAENAITKKTKAIIIVHLYGQPAQLDKFTKLAKKYNIYLIEDCAQSHLSTYNGKFVGNFGTFGCFSFYPGKNLGSFGEAGAITTQNKKLFNKLQILKNHGSKDKYNHIVVGHNYRMEGLQGAVLSTKMAYLKKWNERRRQIADIYTKNLKSIEDLSLNLPLPQTTHTFHQFVIRTSKRDKLFGFLKTKGIETGIHYPVPCHLQKAYKHLEYRKGAFPIAENLSRTVLSLPIYPELTNNQAFYVVSKIKEFFK